jgi:hypothetical protein
MLRAYGEGPHKERSSRRKPLKSFGWELIFGTETTADASALDEGSRRWNRRVEIIARGSDAAHIAAPYPSCEGNEGMNTASPRRERCWR